MCTCAYDQVCLCGLKYPNKLKQESKNQDYVSSNKYFVKSPSPGLFRCFRFLPNLAGVLERLSS